MPRKFFKVVSGFAVNGSIPDHTGQYEVSLFVLSALSFRHSSAYSVGMFGLLKAGVFMLISTVGCLDELHAGKCRIVLPTVKM